MNKRKGREIRDGGEVTVGDAGIRCVPVTPRIVGEENVARFKAMWGVCPEAGCSKQAKHAGDCT